MKKYDANNLLNMIKLFSFCMSPDIKHAKQKSGRKIYLRINLLLYEAKIIYKIFSLSLQNVAFGNLHNTLNNNLIFNKIFNKSSVNSNGQKKKMYKFLKFIKI